MADPRIPTSHADLERDLRSMILGNVTMAAPANDRYQRDSYRERGRGGGQYHQGRSGQFSRPWRGGGGRNSRGGRDAFNDFDNQQASQLPGQMRIQHRPRGSFQARQPPRPRVSQEELEARYVALERIAGETLATAEMSPDEFHEKDRFRLFLQQKCQEAIYSAYSSSGEVPMIQLVPFGSFASGLGAPGSDMDLALVTSHVPPGLPRVMQKALLDAGIGARLLTRTRVPILKICSNPTKEIFEALSDDRATWEALTPEEQEKYDNPALQDEAKEAEVDAHEDDAGHDDSHKLIDSTHGNGQDSSNHSRHQSVQEGLQGAVQDPAQREQSKSQRKERTWYRERRLGPLDFPKDGVGVQCDINFQNQLGICNTHLLRCYTLCDIRVRLLILIVKSWASRRKINSSYNGTLSSYGYVLMVLHFLVNVCKPPLCPNLQVEAKRRSGNGPPNLDDPREVCQGYDVRFWGDDKEIQFAAQNGSLTANRAPLGVLLHDFFHYYSQQGPTVPERGFMWTKDVLSLRTPGGIITKESKGWTGAKTTIVDNKEVRNRYLFAIEDPFEVHHNVARTVTHWGIVAIRDEFRRAWRILVGMSGLPGWVNKDGGLMDEMSNLPPPQPQSTDVTAGGPEEEGEKDETQSVLDAVVAKTSITITDGAADELDSAMTNPAVRRELAVGADADTVSRMMESLGIDARE